MADKAYRGISPAIAHGKDKVITHVLRASLINAPNLIGLASLHQEGHDVMDWKVKLCELLGLASDASDEDIAAALKTKLEAGSETALQSALAPIAKVVGLAENATPAAVLAGVTAIAGTDQTATIVALQGEVTTLATQINQLTEDGTRKAATAFVDAAIRAGHVGVKPQRERYISLHMADAGATEAQIKALPILHGTRLSQGSPTDADPDALDETETSVVALMGLDPEAFKKNRDATRKETL
jgi:outer membrane murein-binding lipoprotein Lpp